VAGLAGTGVSEALKVLKAIDFRYLRIESA